MELEAVIKERIQERFDILQELYTIWFTENPAYIVPKKRFYPDAHIERQRTITYLLNKGFIVADPLERDPEMVAVSITVHGIDFLNKVVWMAKAMAGRL